jgi:putative addiction module CopG family antidote
MLLHLPRHLQEFVEREVASGHYASKDEVIADALERLAGDSTGTITVAEAVAESLAQIGRGEGRALTDEVLDELLRLSEMDAEAGVTVRDEVKY